MAFELVQERHGGVLVLTPRGRLDNDNAAEFELAAQELLVAGERHIVVDLSELNYTSNAGLRVLGKMGKALKTPATSLMLCGLTPTLRQVFDAAGIALVFNIRPDLAQALGDHPAAQSSGELGRQAARLLGVASPADSQAPVPESIRTLTALATELMASGAAAPRRAHAMVDATQLAMRKVRPEDIARARGSEPQGKGSWWQRLFKRGKST